MPNFSWANVKSVLLHAGIVFVTIFGTTLTAGGYSADKAAVLSAIAAAATAALHYLAGLLPNADASANRAAARRESA